MTPSKFLYGFFGGLLGFLLASTLALHEGWNRLTNFRQSHPTNDAAFYFGSFVLIPLLLFIGVIGSPFIAGYSAYLCGKNESLQPLVNTLTEPYLHDPTEPRLLNNLRTGILFGYSTVLVLTSFTLLNIITGNTFGILGAAGAALFSTFGLSNASFVSSFFATIGLTYLGGAIGGTIGSGSTLIAEKCFGLNPGNNEGEPFYYELDEQSSASSTPTSQQQVQTDPKPSSSTTRPSILKNNWSKRDTATMDLMANDDSEDEEEVITFVRDEKVEEEKQSTSLVV